MISSRTLRVVSSAAFAVLCLVARPIHAQDVDAVTAVANVTATIQQPLSIAKTNDLDFETVVAGTNKTVPVTSDRAATFVFHGAVNSEVHLTFSLPATLTDGTNTLLITDWVARYGNSSASYNGEDFTPSATPKVITIGASGTMYLFLGATIKPTVAQAAGAYTGTVTLTVAYL